MATPRERKKVFKRSDFVEPLPSARPIKFKGYVIPDHFYYTAYLFDSDGKEVTKANDKNYKTWSVQLLIRVTKTETLEVITSTISGGSDYKGHTIARLGAEPKDKFSKLQPVKASFYKAVADYRANFMANAITMAVQFVTYKKLKDGKHAWEIGRVERTEQELQVLGKGVIKQTYIRKDDAFYREVARIYEDSVNRGESPNETLKQIYDKDSTKTVQGWTTECRKRGLLAKADKGKVSAVRKTVRKTATRKKGK